MEIDIRIIIRISIGVVVGIVVGILFITAIPLIQPAQHFVYWIMLIIGCIAPCLVTGLIFQEKNKSIGRGFVIFSLFGGVSFGIEGMILAFSASGILWGFLPLIIAIVLGYIVAHQTREAGNGAITVMAIIAIGGFILGYIYGGTLAILLVSILIATNITGFIGYVFGYEEVPL